VRIAACDVARLSRPVAGCAGLAVASFGALSLLRPVGGGGDAAAALVPAGLALLLIVLPVTRPAVRIAGYALGAATAALGATALGRHPAAAVATLLTGLALACIDVRVRRSPGVPAGYRVADPLLAGAAIIALVALVPPMFAPALPQGRDPGPVMSPDVAGALLTLALGGILARPGPTREPGITVRRVLAAMIGMPVLAALVSVLAVRSGISRPTAAISIGSVVAAAIALLAVAGHLVRSIEDAGGRQRELDANTLLQSMNEAVMVLDANHRVIDVNRRWRELTGHGDDAAPDVLPVPIPPPGTSDFSIRRADGTDVPVLATMATIPYEDGSPRAYVATYVDIADRKAAEEALSDHAAELERGNAQLRESNAQLAAALAFKNDLTSMLTHDVAQPISSIASLAELLSADWAGLSDDIRHELALKINKNTQRLIKMMNDLHLLFRLDTGSVTARRTPIPLLEVAESVAAGTAAGHIEIEIDEETSALADRGHLTAVMQNLVSNALAYGRPPVEIRADCQADTVALIVRDHGPGIGEELVPKLFDRFVRGAGLGLFIVRHLVEANGGTVRYERAEPTGARLIVTLESASI